MINLAVNLCVHGNPAEGTNVKIRRENKTNWEDYVSGPRFKPLDISYYSVYNSFRLLTF